MNNGIPLSANAPQIRRSRCEGKAKRHKSVFYRGTTCCGDDRTAGGEEVGGGMESAGGLRAIWRLNIGFLALLLILFHIIARGAVPLAACAQTIDSFSPGRLKSASETVGVGVKVAASHNPAGRPGK